MTAARHESEDMMGSWPEFLGARAWSNLGTLRQEYVEGLESCAKSRFEKSRLALETARAEILAFNADREMALRQLRRTFSEAGVHNIASAAQHIPFDSLLDAVNSTLVHFSRDFPSPPAPSSIRSQTAVKEEQRTPERNTEPANAKRHAEDDHGCHSPDKRARCSTDTSSIDNHNHDTAVPSPILPDRFKTIGKGEVAGQHWVVQRDSIPGKLFIIQCDRLDCRLPKRPYRTDPFANDQAKKHFNHKRQWHGSHSFTEEEIICLFGYEVIGATAEWARQNNEMLIEQAARAAGESVHNVTPKGKRTKGTAKRSTKPASKKAAPEADMGPAPQHGGSQSPSFPVPLRQAERPVDMDGMEGDAVNSALRAMGADRVGDSVTVADPPPGAATAPPASIWDVPT